MKGHRMGVEDLTLGDEGVPVRFFQSSLIIYTSTMNVPLTIADCQTPEMDSRRH
jgi:hypothetical protein